MRIDCPRCSATYDIPTEKVPPGRSVRCVRCSELWTPIPGDPKPAPLPPPSMPLPGPQPLGRITPMAVTRTPAAPRSMTQRVQLPAAWLLTVLVLAIMAWQAISRRSEIIHAWPPSERAYIALGLAPRD